MNQITFVEYNFYGENRKQQYDERVPCESDQEMCEHAEYLAQLWNSGVHVYELNCPRESIYYIPKPQN